MKKTHRPVRESAEAPNPEMPAMGTTDDKAEAPVIMPIDPMNTPSMKKMMPIIGAVYIILILLGVATGYALSRSQFAASVTPSGSVISTGKVTGSTDTKTFSDSAVGVIEKGGLDGEGTHKLIRDGGPSQTAYLISSVVDLDSYVGKKVKVWGQTIAAKKVSWLMDVGKVELQ